MHVSAGDSAALEGFHCFMKTRKEGSKSRGESHSREDCEMAGRISSFRSSITNIVLPAYSQTLC